jgi:hypothetical protein
LGYAIGVGIMSLLGLDGAGFITWLVGIILAVVVIFVTFRWNLQKYVIILATSVGGALVIIATFMLGIEGMAVADLGRNAVRFVLDQSFWWTLFWLVLVILGLVVQLGANRTYTVEPYENRI